MDQKNFDIVVVGGGPGGYVAAIRAAQLGMKVAVIEANHMGGICLNWGCIPTKALLRSAEVYHLFHRAEEFGLKADNVSFDMKKIVARSRDVASTLSSGVSHLMKKHKVEVIDGFASFSAKDTLKVEKDGEVIAKVQAPHIILATGARARQLPGADSDGKHILTYKDALVQDTLPKKLLVVGSGAIGIEFASFFNTLGSEVTVVELADRVLPVEDAEISAHAQKSFEKQGMNIKTGTTVKDIKTSAKGVSAILQSGDKEEKVSVDRVIVAIGIQANTENMNLDGTAIQFDRGFIKTNQWCETHEPGIYAIGDVTQPPWLAHKASHEAVLCVEKIAGLHGVHPINKHNIPGCTYCHPQVASVGLTEAAAIEQGYSVKVGRFPFMGNGKAIALGEPEGLVKTVFDEATGELLGAHMVGAEVTELIQGFTVGKTMEATEEDFMHTIFPHPTLSETMHESVLDAFDRAVHI